MYRKTLLIILAGLAITSCKQETPKEEKSSYKTITLKEESRTLSQEYTARLEGQQVVEIRPQVSGLITQIRINEGQKVVKGQPLFVIDQVPYRAALAEATANVKSAEAKLATARLNLESTRILREKNVVQDYDLSTASNELATAEVKSPVNGVAGMITYRVGTLVSSSISEPLVTVSDDSRMYAYFSMNESQVTGLMEQYGSSDDLIKNMADVELRMAGGKKYGEKGRISAVSGIVTAGTGAVTFRADFPNPTGLLRAGGSATVIVPTVLTHAIVIPQGATYELQNKRFAYTLS